MARSISPRGRLLCARDHYFYPKFRRIATAFVHLLWRPFARTGAFRESGALRT